VSRFKKFDWSCEQCHTAGTIRVFLYPGELTAECQQRHQQETRQRCIEGCRYVALRFNSALTRAAPPAQTSEP